MPAAVSRRRRAPGTTCTACRPPRPRPTTPGCGTTSCTARRRRSGRSCHWRAIGPSDNGDGYVSAAREAAFAGPGKFWGVMRKAPKGRPARPDRRGHQPAHRQGAGTGRTSLSRDQAPVRLPEDALPRAGEEPGAALHALRPRQPVPDATATCGMRRSPSEIGPAAGQAVKNSAKIAANEPTHAKDGAQDGTSARPTALFRCSLSFRCIESSKPKARCS
jgi:hypothetical protein